MLLQMSIEHMYIVYTCYTCLVIHWSMQFIREYLVNVPIQYLILHKGWRFHSVASSCYYYDEFFIGVGVC